MKIVITLKVNGTSHELLVKTNENGIQEWNQTLHGSLDGNALIQTDDGGFVVAGRAAHITQTDSTGKIKWNYTFAESWNDDINDIIQTSDDGYAFVKHEFRGHGTLEKTDAIH